MFTTLCTPIKGLVLPSFHISKRDYEDSVPEGSVGSWYGNGTSAPDDASGSYSGSGGYNPPKTTTLVAVCSTIGSLAIIAVLGFLYMGYRIRREKALAEAMNSSLESEPCEWKEGSQEGSQKEEAKSLSDSGSNEGDGKSSWIGTIGGIIGRGKDDATPTPGSSATGGTGPKKPDPIPSEV